MRSLNHMRDPENTEPWKSEIGNLFPCIFARTTGLFYEHADAVADIVEPFKTLKVFIPQDRRDQLVKVQAGLLRIGVAHFLDFHPVAQQDQINFRPAPVADELTVRVQKQFVSLLQASEELLLVGRILRQTVVE